MPVNRNALIRYRVIDKCLQNRRRRWTIENLIDACNEALYEYDGLEQGVSLRTVRMDLNAMRGDKLGYNAPIIVTEKKYYSYEDAEYSISNIPLTSQDLNVLQEVSHLLRQFKGFSHFGEVTEMVNKLEDKIYSEKYKQAPVIDFEKNELLTGINWLDPLYKAIISQSTIQLRYKSFKARSANEIVFFPYLLKEYRNRWFVLGIPKKNKQIITLALDRIQDMILLPDMLFEPNKGFDPTAYFSNIVGVTRNIGDKPVEVTFFANHVHAPYIRTKPIHFSQKVLEEKEGGILFSITIILNFELERELMGFGEGLKVLSPNSLVRRIKKKVQLMQDLYRDN
jgi:predicted DNA-binding transcriptional regulator YafY